MTSSAQPTAAVARVAALEPVAARTPGGQSRELGRSTLIYGLGTVLSRAASLIMLPVYTRLLTPADYGLLQMLDMSIDIVSILVSAGCTMGLMRFYYKAAGHSSQRRVVASAVVLQLSLNAMGSLLMAAAALPIHRYLLGGEGAADLVLLAAANFTLSSLATVPLLVMQIQRRAALYAVTSLGRLVLQLTLNIIFLVGLGMGPRGILLSTALTSLVVGGGALTWLLRSNGLSPSRAAMRDLVRFGLPYQLVTAGTFILTFGDRFFLNQHWGLATVGIYSLAYQFGFIAHQLGYAPTARAWEPMRFAQVGEPKPDRDAKSREGFLQLNLLLITTVVGIAVLVHPVLRILSSPEFHPAADIVPLVLAAFVLQGWSGVMQFGIDVSEKTKFSTLATWSAVVAVLVLYALLIPPFGALGAAVATVLAFALRTYLFHRFAQRLWHVDYGWPPIVRLCAVAVTAVIAMLAARPGSLAVELTMAAAILGGYAVAVWVVVLDPSHRDAVRHAMRSQVRVITHRFVRA